MLNIFKLAAVIFIYFHLNGISYSVWAQMLVKHHLCSIHVTQVYVTIYYCTWIVFAYYGFYFCLMQNSINICGGNIYIYFINNWTWTSFLWIYSSTIWDIKNAYQQEQHLTFWGESKNMIWSPRYPTNACANLYYKL